ncbi:hypothetical protein NUBL22018_49600 [Klebsiella variicola]|nr:hypothetical protein NUBL22018_49600 [Klebsiella variicola]
MAKKTLTRAERNILWCERNIYIPEGKFVGQPLKMAEFMKDDFRAIFDNKHGTRRAIISRGRKNAKTVETAMLMLLYLVGPEAAPNSQLYSAARSRDQAAILFNLASKMCRMNPVLMQYVAIKDSAKEIHCPELGSYYRALSAEATTATLEINGTEYELVIATYTAKQDAIAVFGDSPVFTSGTASSGGSPAITANVTLAYGSATGVAFSGIPEGTQRLALAHRGNEYRIADADGTTATVQRLIEGVVDPSWSGFSPRTMIDYQATGISDNNTWMGPFLACPESEVVDAFEVNFSFPSGICGFDSKGKKRIRHCEWEIQYRVYGSGSGWTSRQGVYALKNINGLGFTERFDLSSPGLVEVRCRRRNEQGSNNARDSMYWQALRGRLLARPTSYAGVTLMGITVETGGKLAAQSDRRVNVVATRIYDSGVARSISGALYHVGLSLGMEMDTEAIDALEQTYWTPNGEYFDFATGDSISALEMLQKIAAAGKSYFLLNTQSVASVGREGVKPWTGAITPHEMVSEMQTDFSTVTDDDYDGVDVTYINGSTWAEETVQCRLPGNPTPLKIEAYRADGVGNPDHAYQIGMRRLRKYQLQRMTHKTTTELDALCYNVGDRIVLTDDIPGSNTVSCLIESMTTAGGVTTFDVSEPLDWTFANPRVYLRYQDGKASRLFEASPTGDNYQVTAGHIIRVVMH